MKNKVRGGGTELRGGGGGGRTELRGGGGRGESQGSHSLYETLIINTQWAGLIVIGA